MPESKEQRVERSQSDVPSSMNTPVPANEPAKQGQAAEQTPNTNVQNDSERNPSGSRQSAANDTTGKRIEAEAKFVAGPGVKLKGEAELEEVAGGVQIEVEVEDAPAGLKGIHIHQKGDCSDIPGKSMGEHLALGDEKHGLPDAPQHHTGDLGNINIATDGEGKLKFMVPGVHLEGTDPLSLANRAIVIHEAQDVGTGKSGESGKPIACAVIKPG